MGIADSLKAKISPELFSKLNEYEILILQCATGTGRVTKAQAVDLTQKGRMTVQKMLKRLEDSNLLVWHGTNNCDPTQYYTLE